MYEKILVPTDGSETSKAAIDHAIDLAEKYEAGLHALYVVDTDSMSLTLGGEQLDRIEQGRFGEMDEVRERAERATGYVADRAAERGLDTVEHISAGRPHSQIADYVDDNGIDLVVMGSHGRTGVRRALLGSVTERTLRSVRVPVLVIDED
ncbi:universal stress protein [Halopiger aswanensis]|uniref:Nucleotide-binding universal stress UspA family protein n=1 Tax=Halopiger aswanensis TaxID=148449 RepID=A0A3R7DC93_9EURY|nr:universal stress protein [Halopiger aswanensis]RKD97879.1 nucleotide-binding universal stress UspA family protein [Halopiger aswanensis]